MYARKYNYNKREVLAKANELRPPELTDLSASWSMYWSIFILLGWNKYSATASWLLSSAAWL